MPTTRRPGKLLYCYHNLKHEDMDMMRNCYVAAECPPDIAPNGAVDGTDLARLLAA